MTGRKSTDDHQLHHQIRLDSEPDEWELQMGGERLPPDIRRWHQERRWHAARREWILANPEYDWLAELRERRERRRQPTTR
jgi:hypothetical protein